MYNKNKIKKSQKNRDLKYYIKDKINYWNNKNLFYYEDRKTILLNNFTSFEFQAYMIEYKVYSDYSDYETYRFVAYKKSTNYTNNHPSQFYIASPWIQWNLHLYYNKSGSVNKNTILSTDLNLNYKKIDEEFETNVYSYFHWRNFDGKVVLEDITLLEDIYTYQDIEFYYKTYSVDNQYKWLIQRNFISRNSYRNNENTVTIPTNLIHIPNYLVYPKTKLTKMNNLESLYRPNKKKNHNNYVDSELTDELMRTDNYYYTSKLSNNKIDPYFNDEYNLLYVDEHNLLYVDELLELVDSSDGEYAILEQLLKISNNRIEGKSLEQLANSFKHLSILDVFRKGGKYYYIFSKHIIGDYHQYEYDIFYPETREEVMNYSNIEDYTSNTLTNFFYGENMRWFKVILV